MNKVIAIGAVVLGLLGLTVAQTKQTPAPKPRLIEFHMAVMKRGPHWSANLAESAPELQQKHIVYIQTLVESGKAVIAGPIQDDSAVVGVYIFRAKTADEAKSWAMGDPAVAAGHLMPEMHPWWSEDVMKKPTAPFNFTTAYLAFITKGEKWTAETTPATEEIQKGHMANIHRLADMKKLVVAGPFGDDGQLRGIFVFRVATIDEARSLAATDPAVQAGRFALDIHPWMVPEGVLP